MWIGKQQKDLEKRLAQLEESCRGKEAARVDLELRLTEVKENLKKSLASGELGAPAESKPANKVWVLPGVSCLQNVFTLTLPKTICVNYWLMYLYPFCWCPSELK